MNKTPNDKIYAIGIGEIYQEIYQGKEILGGVPLDFAYSCSLAGYKGGVISTLGHDANTALVERGLILRGLSNFCRKSMKHPTGIARLTNDQDRYEDFENPRDWAWTRMKAPKNGKEIAQQTKLAGWSVMAIQHPTTWSVIKDFVADMDEIDTFKVFKMNVYNMHFQPSEALKESLHLCNVLEMDILNTPELCDLMEVPESCPVDDLCQQLISRFDIQYILLNIGLTSKVYYGNQVSIVENTFYEDENSDNFLLLQDAAFSAFFVTCLLRGFTVREAQLEANRILRCCGKTNEFFQERLLFLLNRSSRLLNRKALHDLVDQCWKKNSTTTEVLSDMLYGSMRMQLRNENLELPDFEEDPKDEWDEYAEEKAFARNEMKSEALSNVNTEKASDQVLQKQKENQLDKHLNMLESSPILPVKKFALRKEPTTCYNLHSLTDYAEVKQDSFDYLEAVVTIEDEENLLFHQSDFEYALYDEADHLILSNTVNDQSDYLQMDWDFKTYFILLPLDDELELGTYRVDIKWMGNPLHSAHFKVGDEDVELA